MGSLPLYLSAVGSQVPHEQMVAGETSPDTVEIPTQWKQESGQIIGRRERVF